MQSKKGGKGEPRGFSLYTEGARALVSFEWSGSSKYITKGPRMRHMFFCFLSSLDGTCVTTWFFLLRRTIVKIFVHIPFHNLFLEENSNLETFKVESNCETLQGNTHGQAFRLVKMIWNLLEWKFFGDPR